MGRAASGDRRDEMARVVAMADRSRRRSRAVLRLLVTGTLALLGWFALAGTAAADAQTGTQEQSGGGLLGVVGDVLGGVTQGIVVPVLDTTVGVVSGVVNGIADTAGSVLNPGGAAPPDEPPVFTLPDLTPPAVDPVPLPTPVPPTAPAPVVAPPAPVRVEEPAPAAPVRVAPQPARHRVAQQQAETAPAPAPVAAPVAEPQPGAVAAPEPPDAPHWPQAPTAPAAPSSAAQAGHDTGNQVRGALQGVLGARAPAAPTAAGSPAAERFQAPSGTAAGLPACSPD
ncbi:hypothetical protein BJP25_29840 [Actinokineospora bangkokensis]|uniref:Uncharacterized protein n=1 Tax=Actinokineospora bangkokensis TaxID=1193682 RepID=A0A1Q9LFH0_9PSEU|nr:hypothetical protein BJP25_29840 [Actinokineospora bangkokensis]